MRTPSFTIEAGHGIDRVVVHFERGQQEAGVAFLQKILPALQELDRLSREAEDAGTLRAPRRRQ